jgi:hypothetical protein
MLSGFSGLFDKPFAVGYLLPVLLGMITLAWLYPTLAVLAPLHNLAASSDDLGKLLYVMLAAYVGAITLTMVNLPLYRLIEGYGPLKRWAPGLAKRQRRERARRLRRQSRILRRWAAAGDAFPARRQNEAADLRRELETYWPPKQYEVLPTRFGNVLRAFESYPLEAYGADGAPIWTRLVSVIDKDFATSIDDARAQVDCLINLATLGVLIGLSGVATGLAATPWARLATALGAPATLLGFRPDLRFWAGIAMLASAYPLYLWAVERAVAWGSLVKAAFDCYLPALVKRLGFVMPADEDERRALWTDINALVIYRQRMDLGRWKMADAKDDPPSGFAARLAARRGG